MKALLLGAILAMSGCAEVAPDFGACPEKPSTVDYIMHADTSFTDEERRELGNAAERWNAAACTSRILIRYDRPNAAEVWHSEANAGRRTIVRGTDTAPLSADGKRHDGGTTADRMAVFIRPHRRFYRLALHEFGHLLGLGHDREGTAMHQDVSDGSDFVTWEDFAQCVAVGSCLSGGAR